MHTLNVPYIPQLEDIDNPEQIINLLDERGRRRQIDAVNWKSEYPYKPLSAFTVAHSGKKLYIDFFVRCNFLRAENYEDLSPVSEDSCVEFFVSPKSDGEYWNFEYNCIGTLNASVRTERNNPRRLTAEERARIMRYASCGSRPFRELEGMFTWNLLTAIPLDIIGVEYKGQPIEMSGNFYKCASATSMPHYMSWNPIESEKPDFHRPDCFGKIILE